MTTDHDNEIGFERRLEDALEELDSTTIRPGRRAERGRQRARRRVFTTAAGLAAAVALSAGAYAALSDGASFQPAGEVVARGDEITLKGSGCDGRSSVRFSLDGDALAELTANGDGTFVGRATIPAETTPGTHTLTAVCPSDGEELSQRADIRVIATREPLEPTFVAFADAGGSVSVKGAGCREGSTVTITLDVERDVAEMEVVEDGVFSDRVTLPEDTQPGEHELTATCPREDGTPLVQTVTLTVTG